MACLASSCAAVRKLPRRLPLQAVTQRSSERYRRGRAVAGRVASALKQNYRPSKTPASPACRRRRRRPRPPVRRCPWRPTGRARRRRRTPGLAGTWIGDEARIRQVLSNLVSNAVKFTSTGGLVVSAAASDGSTAPGSLPGLRLAVADTGSGIDPAQMDRLFQKFVQLDESSTRRHGGTGLGLALCADLTSLLEGKIEARRAPGGGMDFVVLLPLETGQTELGETPTHETAAPDVGDSAPLWVLAAEDHPTNRKVLELLLEPTAVHCRFVENGQEAVEAWREQDWPRPAPSARRKPSAVASERPSSPSRPTPCNTSRMNTRLRGWMTSSASPYSRIACTRR